MAETITDLTGYTWTPNDTIDTTNLLSSLDGGTYDTAVKTFNINYSTTCANETYNTPDGTQLSFFKYIITDILPPICLIDFRINGTNSEYFSSIFNQNNGTIYLKDNNFDYSYTLSKNTSYCPTYIVSMFFTGGTDATNTELIAWLQENGTLTKN